MLASDWVKGKRKRAGSKTSTFAVAWSTSTVRFNEETQIVDLADCFNVVYANPETARVAIHKYFGTDREETYRKLGVKEENTKYVIKWENARQGRTGMKARVLKDVLLNVVPGIMKNAPRLAKMLDKDSITVENMNTDIDTSEIVGMSDTTDTKQSCKPSNIPKSTITREDALTNANSTLVLATYNTKLLAEQEEDNLRIKRAKNQFSLEDVKLYEEQCKAQLRVQSEHEQLESDRKRRHEQLESDRKRRHREDLLDRLKVARCAGLASVTKLEQQLDELVSQ